MLRNEGTEGGCLTSLFSTEHGGLAPRERHEMPFERLYPGQLWQRDSTHVIVVAVHPNTVTYEFLSGGQSITQRLDVFLAVFTRLRC
jgi:hypothetical protein